MLRLRVLFFFLLVLSIQSIVAEDIPPIPSDWTPIEQSVWKEILAGNTAKLGSNVEGPITKRQWTDDQKLSARFIKTILTDPILAHQIPLHGAHIDGALIVGGIWLSGLEIPCEVSFSGCHFERIFFDQAKFAKSLSFRDSLVDRDVYGPQVQIGDYATFDGVYLGENITLDDAHVAGSLWVVSCKMDYLWLARSHVREVELWERPDEDFSIKIILDGVKAEKIRFNRFHLADGSSAKNLVVSDSLSLLAQIDGLLELSFSQIAADLDVSEAYLADRLDLTGATVGGSLILSQDSHSAGWGPNASLGLKDTSVNFLRDRSTAWPSTLQIDGFSYKKWRAADSAGQQEEFGHRDLAWFFHWLRSERTYSPEPYRQLASAFRDAGMEDKATSILFEGKQRERHTLSFFPKILSTLALVFTGYGYHYEYSVGWSVGFVVLGGAVFAFTREGRLCRVKARFGISDLFLYSLDAFLPFVKLRNKFGDVDFNGWIRYYFYAHRIAGYVIGSFVLAALAGLTK